MADVSQRRTQHLIIATASALALIAAAAPTARAAEKDATSALVGTWHVLIHYTDDHSHDPEQIRWDDQAWVFERSGSRLRWTQYPIVVFRDKQGRFEPRGGMRAARTLRDVGCTDINVEPIRSGKDDIPFETRITARSPHKF